MGIKIKIDASVVDEANAYAEGSVFRSQAGVGSTVDDPGGGIDDPGGGDIDDLGSLDNLATSTTTSSKTSVSFVSSSLTTRFSLMSLSDKSAVDASRLGGRRWYMDDCATGSFCSSRAPSRRVWRVDFGVMEWGVMRAAIPLGCCVVGVAES